MSKADTTWVWPYPGSTSRSSPITSSAIFGTREQQRQYLLAAAAGKITLSFAVSEPGHGAHPKLLTTTAQKQDNDYMLNGEKTYLTNGPIAGYFYCRCRNRRHNTAKAFYSLYRAARPRKASPSHQPLAMNFLKPSPHGGIKLENCLIGQKSVLGKEGNAWRDMVVPLGEIEDVVMMGPVLGGMAAQLAMLMDAIREQPTEPDIHAAGENWEPSTPFCRRCGSSPMKQPTGLIGDNASPVAARDYLCAAGRANFTTGITQITDSWKITASARIHLSSPGYGITGNT